MTQRLTEREAFEAWLRAGDEFEARWLNRRDFPESERFGDYCDNSIEWQWKSWQARAALSTAQQEGPAAEPVKLWLWKNFVDGRPEYWAFDNPFPIHLDNGDPQTLGEPCGYAIVKPSRAGRSDVSESEVLRRIAISKERRHG